MALPATLDTLQANIERLVDELILARLQIESLEEENAQLLAEQQRWKHDLSLLIGQMEDPIFPK